ncbi:Putative peptidase M3A/M3B catalytic domain, neurolysin/Thimet oligopeptidase, domain 2 [Septoria linicola]|uniref:Peptidase M3A/M3B catalytic domain, neurolysin/Thimet oligopeptidase, domain 2 n=1 Tax=Septoria linicola TaxID=215465 RepID=A0A9Q9EH41_9PEZI|nr:Putative peptidase M3A/M3B catalytic domain, neurolysin/Thimet oligopeptidase, domain 2 [Septoria linicola]
MLADYGEKENAVVQDIIKNVKPEEATFKNSVLPYIHHENEASVKSGLPDFYAYLSSKRELQTKSSELASNLSDITQKTYLSEDYFARINRTYYTQANDTELNTEDQKLLYTLWKNFQDAGLAVPKGKERDRYQDITKELIVVANEYMQANTDDNTTLWFTREELNGTKEDTLSTLDKGTGENEGKLKLPLQSASDTSAVLNYCVNETTRRTVFISRANRTPENVGRLKKAVVLRDESARLQGAPNFATHRIQENMAKTPEAVHKLLDDTQARVKSTVERRIDHLKELKESETGTPDPIFLWDFGYYSILSNEREYNLSNEKIKEYFPSEPTMRAILDLYAELFHLQFVKIEEKDGNELSATGKAEDLVYAPDVELYSVWNDEAWSPHRKRSDEDFVGYLYLDMYRRDGKPGGAYTVPIENGFSKEDGSRHFPSCVMVTNFKKSTSDNPSLLYRGEVQTILHELGHAMHHLTSQVAYQRFHGFNGCPPDFFEAPSQLMENFAFEPEVLKRFSKHWSYLSDDSKAAWIEQQNATDVVQPPEKMPDDIIAEIRNSRNAYSSNGELGQIFLSTFDLRLHEPATHEDAEKIDTTELFNLLNVNITGVKGPEAQGQGYKWGHPESASFTHTMTGYEAGYYSYHWSRVYCKDLFYTAFKGSPFNREQGGRFRELVLEPGGSKDFVEILTDFLGHEPSNQAYFDDLELDKQ